MSLGSSARLQLRSLAGWPIVEPGRWWPERVLAGHFPVIDDNDSSTEKRWFDATKRSLRHPSSDDHRPADQGVVSRLETLRLDDEIDEPSLGDEPNRHRRAPDMTGLQATAVDSYPLGHVIDPPPRVQGIERIAQPFQVLLGHLRHDINVNCPQQGSLQATGEAPENDVVNSMTKS